MRPSSNQAPTEGAIMPNANIASTRSRAFDGYQVSFEVPRPSIEEVAIQALEEPALEEV